MILSSGAEAIIEQKGNIVLKKRIPKKYRLTQIDNSLRKQRTRKEASILNKVNRILPSPKLISFSDEKMEIEMEYVEGKKARDCFSPQIAYEIGKIVGKLHSNDIVHGDLTTSNFIVNNGKVFALDFGLSAISKKIEDKAVDLHLLSQALESKHHEMHKELEKDKKSDSKKFVFSNLAAGNNKQQITPATKCWQKVIEGYKETNKDWKSVFERLVKVEKRGRNK